MDSASLPWRSPLRSSGSREWTVAAIVLVMAALTVGWPLIDRTLDDNESVPDGAVLQLGPGNDTAALHVVGEDWLLSKSASDPDMSYDLFRGGVDVVADYVDLIGPSDAEQLWSGLRKVQSVVDSDSRLGAPRLVSSTAGAKGVTGALSRDDLTGTATVWVSPGGDYAVAITVLAGPDADPGASAEGRALVRSVAFPGEAL
jgi:hypothetical protein